jgi:hypothetical protein
MKLKFWEKEDEIMPDPPERHESFPELAKPIENPSSIMESKYAQPTPHGSPDNKDLEIISAKLDSIKAMLESLNHRVESIERLARDNE